MSAGTAMSMYSSGTPELILMPVHPNDWEVRPWERATGMAAQPGPSVDAGRAGGPVHESRALADDHGLPWGGPEQDDVGVDGHPVERAVNDAAVGPSLDFGDVGDLFLPDVLGLAHHPDVLHEKLHLLVGKRESHDHRAEGTVVVVLGGCVEDLGLGLAPECAARGDGAADPSTSSGCSSTNARPIGGLSSGVRLSSRSAVC